MTGIYHPGYPSLYPPRVYHPEYPSCTLPVPSLYPPCTDSTCIDLRYRATLDRGFSGGSVPSFKKVTLMTVIGHFVTFSHFPSFCHFSSLFDTFSPWVYPPWYPPWCTYPGIPSLVPSLVYSRQRRHRRGSGPARVPSVLVQWTKTGGIRPTDRCRSWSLRVTLGRRDHWSRLRSLPSVRG